MPAQTYDDLIAEIQSFVDSNNPAFVASIPTFISDAESRFNRLLELPEQECKTSTALVPEASPCALPPGDYALPHNLVQFKTIWSDGTYLWLYYLKTIPSLSNDDLLGEDATNTNWLLSKYPDLYRYQALVCAESFLKDDPRVPLWKDAVDEILAEVEAVNQRSRYSGSALRSRTPGEAPSDRASSGITQYQVLPVWDFVQLAESGACAGSGEAYYTISGDKLRIWPVPGSQ